MLSPNAGGVFALHSCHQRVQAFNYFRSPRRILSRERRFAEGQRIRIYAGANADPVSKRISHRSASKEGCCGGHSKRSVAALTTSSPSGEQLVHKRSSEGPPNQRERGLLFESHNKGTSVSTFDDNDVRGELHRIVNSPHFEASDRNRRFLGYAVEETLAGRAKGLKAYSIATLVFGRGEDFDPILDPVVRMEARRVRRALERFYLIEGDSKSHLRIDMPRGGYVPEFQRSGFEGAAINGANANAGRFDPGEMPIIVVAAFSGSGEPKALLDFDRGFARHVMIALHKLGYSVASGFDPEVQTVERPTEGKIKGGERRMLTGDLAVAGNNMSVTALMMQEATGRVLWGFSFRRELSTSTMPARDELAHLLAQELHTHLTRSALTVMPACSRKGRR